MWWFTMGRDKDLHASFWLYLKKVYALPLHFLTQKRYAKCERKRPWAIHLALMLSYVMMLVLIMFFLGAMWSGPEIDWRVHVFGYIATVGLLGTTIFALQGRIRKSEPLYAHSHETDWIFLILLIIVAFTGILQHIMHRAGLDAAANIVYIIHLMGVVPMLALEVPFSKWAHLAYRPLAMYFSLVRAEAKQRAGEQAAQPVMVTQRVVG
jgi:nitrate reductase gamma subunit